MDELRLARDAEERARQVTGKRIGTMIARHSRFGGSFRQQSEVKGAVARAARLGTRA